MRLFGAGKCHLPIGRSTSRLSRGCPGPAEKSQRGGVPQRQDPFRESHATPLRSRRDRAMSGGGGGGDAAADEAGAAQAEEHLRYVE